jgi:hypothetical protein
MPVSLRLGAELEDRLATVSRKLRMNKTELIKRSVEAYLSQIEPGRSPYELGGGLFAADESPGRDVSSRFKQRLKRKLRAKHHR